MRFYTQQHKHYCGIDLHARMMYLCILDAAGTVRLSRNIECSPKAFLAAVKAFRDDLVVAVECMFAWYWLADLCARGGHRLRARPRAVHARDPRRQGQERQDRRAQDRRRCCAAGCIPQAYVYPAADARHPRSAAPPQSPDAQARGAHRPHPEHGEPVQPAALGSPHREALRPRRGCLRTSPTRRCATPWPWIWP